MLVMPSGIFTLARFVQPENAFSPMLVTLEGIVISLRLLQFRKDSSPILVTPSGIFTSARFVQPLNAPLLMTVTLEGIVISLRLLHS